MKMTKNTRQAGFTLVEIMIVVAIIGLLAAIAIPNFVSARQNAQTGACINNLRQIDSAKAQWALENGKKDGDAIADADVIALVGKAGTTTAGSDVCCPLTAKGTVLGGYTGNLGAIGVLPVCGNYDATKAAGGKHPAALDPALQ